MDTTPFTCTALIITVATMTSCLRQNNVQEMTCAERLRHIYTADVISEHPPRIIGLWTSTQCEVRPGPEYVLRQYSFHDGSLFDLRLFHYVDSDCHNASHVISARGRLQPYQQSWIIRGAAEMDYQLRLASVVPYTQAAADRLRQKLGPTDRYNHTDTNTCTEQIVASPWKPFERRDVFKYVEGEDDYALSETEWDSAGVDSAVSVSGGATRLDHLDCLAALDVSVHELQLVRVEETRHLATSSDRHLLLGDIHSDIQQRAAYRPMGFQQPLVLHNTSGCNKVCEQVAMATEWQPPQLSVVERQSVVWLLDGDWVSQRCEARPYGVFLTRHFQLSTDSGYFTARHKYFADLLCRHALYSVDTSGNYSTSTVPSAVDGAFHVDFNTSSVSLTLHDKRLVRQLNYAGTCGAATWRIEQQQDVTATQGCPALHLSVVCTTEWDIARVDRRPYRTLLHLGQRPTDGSHLTRQHDRPTAFQPELVRCSSAGIARTANTADRLHGKAPHREFRQKGVGKPGGHGGGERGRSGLLYLVSLVTVASSVGR